MLNRLYLNSTNKSEAEAYGYKLLAEKMYTIGCYKYAQLFAIKYVDLKEKSDSYKKDVNLKKREKYTEVQELFVMCHELAHWILADGENNELMNNKREFLIDVFNNYNDISFPEPFMEYFINIRYNAFFDKDEEPRKLRLPSEYKEVKEEEFDRNKLKNLILKSNSIIEECVCDDIAFMYLISLMNKRTDISGNEIAQAVLIGLESLTVLSIIDNSATDFLNCNSYEVRGFINESIIRKSNFRNFTWGGGLNKDFNIEDIKKVEETLKNVNIKYSKMITDPILFRVAERIKAEKTLYDSVEIDETDQKKFDFILKL